MQVTVHVPVWVKGSPPPQRAERTIVGSVPTVYEIPEYSMAELPVAFVCTVERPSRNSEFTRIDKIRRTERVPFHTDGESFFTAAGSNVLEGGVYPFFYWRGRDSGHAFFDVSLRGLEDAVSGKLRNYSPREAARAFSPPSFAAAVSAADAPYELPAMDTYGNIDFRHADLDHQLETFARRMERFVSVDGMLYLREPEPLLRVRSDHNAIGVEIARRPEGGPLSDGRIDETTYAYYRMDQLEEAVDFARSLADAFGRAQRVKVENGEIDIVEPSWRGASTEGLTLVTLASLLRSRMCMIAENSSLNRVGSTAGERMLNSLSLEAFVVFKKLGAGLETSSETHVDPLIEEAVFEAVRNPELHRYFFPTEADQPVAESMIARWEDRPVELATAVASYRP